VNRGCGRATGNDEAGFYVGDSPQADTVVRDDQAYGNQFGIFIRHARHVLVTDNHVSGNCQGILVLDDGQPGGAGNATIVDNSARVSSAPGAGKAQLEATGLNVQACVRLALRPVRWGTRGFDTGSGTGRKR